jgi:hypothetical protein
MKTILLCFITCAALLDTGIKCNWPMMQTANYFLRVENSPPSTGNNTLKNTNPVYTNKYRRIENYIPGDSTPVKIVQVNVNVFTGPGSLQDTPADRKQIAEAIDWVNIWYTNNSAPTDTIPGVKFIKDTKIRFAVDNRIYFYDNTDLHKSCNVFQMEKVVKKTDSTRMNFLNIYLTIGACTQSATPPFPGFDYYSTTNGMYGNQYVLMPVPVPISYASVQTLAHELGHTLDLMHTYEHSCCHETCDPNSPEYLDDVFGPPGQNKKCWHDGGWSCDPNDKNNTCTNNMMGGVATVAYYFSPKQIGKMHRALAVKSAKRYVKDAYTHEPLYITESETWDFDMRCYSDIRVKKGATLTIKGKITIPQQCKVYVERGGQVIVEGGVLENYAGKLAEVERIK